MFRLDLLLTALVASSGAATLIYEAVVLRCLRLELGAAQPAGVAILALFLATLALGGIWGGRLAGRSLGPLRLFGWAQVASATGFALLPVLLRALRPLIRALDSGAGDTDPVLTLARLGVAASVLLVPGLLLGASLPLAVRAADRCPSGHGGFTLAGPARAGLLAAWYTLGGAVGCLLCLFTLLPRLGSDGALRVACLLGALAGGAAIVAARAQPPPVAGEAQPATAVYADRQNRWRAHGLLLLYGGVAGLTLGGGLLWTRILTVWMGSSIYIAGLVASVFLFGLALGGAWASRLARRSVAPAAATGVVVTLAGLLLLLALRGLPVAVAGSLHLSRVTADGFSRLLALQGLAMASLLLPPALLLGMAFPLVLSAATRGIRDWQPGAPVPPAILGRLMACGGSGGALGALVAIAVIVPRLGVERGLQAAAMLAGLLGTALLMADADWLRGRRYGLRGGVAVVPLLLGLAAASVWPRPAVPLLAQGVFSRWVRGGNIQLDGGGQILTHHDGWSTAVTVRALPDGERMIDLDGKPEVASVGDLPNLLLAAHLPLLLHANPHRVAVVGLGSGATAGSAACHPVDQVDCAEFEPALVPAARLLSESNQGALDNSRIRVRRVDGRRFLSANTGRYDVVISQPSNPWVSGMADRFTREFFALCRDALAPGGRTCVWIEGYALSTSDFRRIVATFQSVFPHAQMWCGQPCEYLLVGARDPLKAPADRLQERFERAPVFRDLARIGVRALPDLLANFVMDTAALQAFAAGARPLTDGGRSLAHSAPQAMLDPGSASVVMAQVESGRSRMPDWLLPGQLDVDVYLALTDRVETNLAARAAATEARFLAYRDGRDVGLARARHAAQLNPRDAFILRMAKDIANEGGWAMARGDPRIAAMRFIELLGIQPDSVAGHLGAGAADSRLGRKESAYWHFVRAVAADPTRIDSRMALAGAAWENDDAAECVRQYRLVLAQEPNNVGALHNLAVVLSHAAPPLRNLAESVQLAEQACVVTRWQNRRMTQSLRDIYVRAGRSIDALRLKQQIEKGSPSPSPAPGPAPKP